MESFEELFYDLDKNPKVSVTFKSLVEGNENFRNTFKVLFGESISKEKFEFTGAIIHIDTENCLLYVSKEFINDCSKEELEKYTDSWSKLSGCPIADIETEEGKDLIAKYLTSGIPIVEANGGGIKWFIYNVGDVGTVICAMNVKNVCIKNGIIYMREKKK